MTDKQHSTSEPADVLREEAASELESKRYSISELANAAGVSVRTLRYYDQIGLLTPRRKGNDYRVYGDEEVKKLQHILVLRSCGLPLADISSAMRSDGFDLASKLREHLQVLATQMDITARAIETTKRMLEGLEAFDAMSNEERFEQLKKDSVSKFEAEYGEEARALYGDAAIEEANGRLLNMSKLAWDAKEELEQRVRDTLVRAMATGDPASPESRMLAELHAQWIRVHWGEGGYSPEAHRNLVRGYMDDPRFIAYYDTACGEGATGFLRDAVIANI